MIQNCNHLVSGQAQTKAEEAEPNSLSGATNATPLVGMANAWNAQLNLLLAFLHGKVETVLKQGESLKAAY